MIYFALIKMKLEFIENLFTDCLIHQVTAIILYLLIVNTMHSIVDNFLFEKRTTVSLITFSFSMETEIYLKTILLLKEISIHGFSSSFVSLLI